MNSCRLGSFAVLILAATATHAGVVTESVKRNTTTGQETRAQSLWVQNGMARIESTGAANQTTVLLFKDDSFYSLDAASKSYRVMDKAALEQTSTMLAEALAKLPPEQRKVMEQMVRERGGTLPGTTAAGGQTKLPVYDAQPTGGSATLEGRSCKLWTVTRDGVASQQLCVVSATALPGGDELIAFMKRMNTLIGKVIEPFGVGLQQTDAVLAKIQGYPIMTRQYRNGALAPEQTIVKSWKQQAIDPAKFEVPADYAKQEMPARE